MVWTVYAHRMMRKRGISTRPSGQDSYEEMRQNALGSSPATGTDDSEILRFLNALMYGRLYFELEEDPEIEANQWEHIDGWFKTYLSKTRTLGRTFVDIIREEGLKDAESCRRALLRVMEGYTNKQFFIMFWRPTKEARV